MNSYNHPSISTWRRGALGPLGVALLALALILPLMATAPSTAQAQNKSSLKSARKSAKKKSVTRKKAVKKTTKKARKKATGDKAVVRKRTTRKRVVRERRTRTRRTRTRTRRTRVTRRPVGSNHTTVVYHGGHGHHHNHYTRSSARHHDPEPEVYALGRDRRDGPYFGLGLGVASIDNDVASSGGTSLGFSLGMRQGRFALELGLLGAAQPIEEVEGELSQNLSFGGFSADARIFLPGSGVLEPYGQVGLGYFSVGTSPEEPFHTAVNLGGGLDLRLSRALAIGGRYLYHGFFFDAPDGDLGRTESTWTAMGTMTVYF